jgi:glycosyltransferase involved in cell wall biosynthesis
MPYNAAALESLVKLNSQVTIDIFSWGRKKKLTPFIPPEIERVNYHTEADFDFEHLLTLYRINDYKLIYICNRREKKYLQLARYARKRGTIIIGQSDEQLYGGLRQYIKKVFSYFLYRRYFDYMFVPGYFQYEFMRYLGFKKEKILIGAYTANISLFDDFYHRNNVIGDKRTKRLLYIGRLEAEKGIELFIKALSKIDHSYNFKFVVIGNGSLKNILSSYSFIEHYPFMDQPTIVNLLSDIDFFVLPSNYEPWGVVIHEMAAAGIPIICSDACGARASFVFNNYNGFIFKNNSLDSIIGVLKEAYVIPKERMLEFKRRSNELAKSITPDLWGETINSFLR